MRYQSNIVQIVLLVELFERFDHFWPRNTLIIVVFELIRYAHPVPTYTGLISECALNLDTNIVKEVVLTTERSLYRVVLII